MFKLITSMKLILIFFVLFVPSEAHSKSAIKTSNLTASYQRSLSTSLHQERKDRLQVNKLIQGFQVDRIKVATRHRLQMERHKEHCFENTNSKWRQCLKNHRKEINNAEMLYYDEESGCLLTATTAGNAEKGAVEQLEKEIRKWRKGYRYLVHLCSSENFDDVKSYNSCLVDYMQRDNYGEVIERLLALKQDAMRQLLLELVVSLNALDSCLDNVLSLYLDSVRTIMESLNECYII